MVNAARKNILLVEDEALVAMAEAMLLKKHGYGVLTVYSGEQAIETVQSTPETDLILMDIDLGRGRMDGTRAAELILRQRDVPLVFLSSHTEQEVVDKTEGITSYGYIVKNSGETVLIASIKMAFRLFEARLREQKKEEGLRRSEERYQSFVRQSHEAIYCTEFDQPIDTTLPVEQQIDAIYQNAYMGECNYAMAAMYGLPSIDSLTGQRMIDFHGGKDNPVNRATFRRFIASNYRTIESETEEVAPDGTRHVFQSNDIGIVESGCLLRIWGTAIDITRHKAVENALRESEARLKTATENAHRELQQQAKNSFALLTSLIGLMENANPGVEAGNALAAVEARIRGVAELYDLFYAAGAVNKVQLGEYCFRVVASLHCPEKVRLQQTYAATTAAAETAVLLRLIITEWLTQAIQQASPAGRQGNISISLSESAGRACVQIEDDGIGVPGDAVGLTLLQALVRQLRGTLQINRLSPGTLCVVEFPLQSDP